MKDDPVIIEVKTDMSYLYKLPVRRRLETLKRGAHMGVQMMKGAIVEGSSLVAVFDRSGKFEVLRTLEDCQRIFAGSRLHKSDD